MVWHVFTDGSAICDESVPQENSLGKRRFPGGWAAVIEHGSDGYVIRGREADTTNVRMELRAVIEGLKQVPDGEMAVLHFDCTVVFSVREHWMSGTLDRLSLVENPKKRAADLDLWFLLGDQFSRIDVALTLIGRGPNPVHRRAHGIAQTEAKAMAAGLPENGTVLGKIEKKERRRAAALAFDLAQDRSDRLRRKVQVEGFGHSRIKEAFAERGLRHAAECEPGSCVSSCEVWLNFGLTA